MLDPRQGRLDAWATSTVFVPGCRWIASTTARSSLNQLADLVVLHVVEDLAESPRRTGEPLR